MTTIKKHLEQDPSRAEELNKILKRGTLTFNEWSATGKFYTAKQYSSKIKLDEDCKQVIEYVGLSVIQVLSTGEFVFGNYKSKSLYELEKNIWPSIAEKLWCETC